MSSARIILGLQCGKSVYHNLKSCRERIAQRDGRHVFYLGHLLSSHLHKRQHIAYFVSGFIRLSFQIRRSCDCEAWDSPLERTGATSQLKQQLYIYPEWGLAKNFDLDPSVSIYGPCGDMITFYDLTSNDFECQFAVSYDS